MGKQKKKQKKLRARNVLAGAGGLAVAVGGGLAIAYLTPAVNTAGESLVGQDKVVTLSAREVEICNDGGLYFVPNDDPDTYVPSVSAGDLRGPDCEKTRAEIGAASTSLWLDVSIQAETDRPVTIVEIEAINVTQAEIPNGTYVLPAQVGGAYPSKYVAFDLDQKPVVAVDLGDFLQDGSYLDPGTLATRTTPLTEDQATLPWLVTKDEPLQLGILADGSSFDTTLSFRVSWQSGEKTGELLIDNGGAGYRTVGTPELWDIPNFITPDMNNEWARWSDATS